MTELTQGAPWVSRTGGREATHGVIPGRFALSVGPPSLPAPSGWRWTPLSEVAQLESGHTPSRRHPEYWDGGVPWVAIKDAVDNHGGTIHDTYQHVADLGLQNSSARLLPARTVCLSRTASVGYVVLMGRPMATSQDFVDWVCGPGLDPEYLKYILLAERDSLLRFASGTTHQTIYYPEAKAFHVLLPPPAQQQSILSVVKPLDDLIELNRRMNQTLEAMAQALFKSWFVDFDPVRAKAEGRQPMGMDAQTAALFPSSLEVSSEGDSLPSGWTRATVGDVLNLAYGKALKADERRPGCVPVYGSNGQVGVHDEKLSEGPGIVVGRKGNPGVVTWVPQAFYAIDTTFYVVPKHPEMPLRYLFHSLAAQDLAGLAADSAVPGVNRNLIYRNPILVPDTECLLAFDNLVAPLWKAQHANNEESQSLGTIRDTLLPKLLSGELRVKDADSAVAAAV